MQTKVRLAMHLKLWHRGEEVYNATLRIKKRIMRAAQKTLWDKAYLKVTYDHNNQYQNAGNYYSLTELKRALSAFTEEALLKDFVPSKKSHKTKKK